MKLVVAALLVCLCGYECLSGASIDYKTATGDEIVACCMSKKCGFSDLQFEHMENLVAGRRLTFSRGVLKSATQQDDGSIMLRVEYFQRTGSDSKLFPIIAVVTGDSEIRKAKKLVLKQPIVRISGVVEKQGIGSLCLTDVCIELEGGADENEYDRLKTGDQIAKYYSSKGWTQVQEEEFFAKLTDRVLRFSKTSVYSVDKTWQGDVFVELWVEENDSGNTRCLSDAEIDALSEDELMAMADSARETLKNFTKSLKTGACPLRVNILCKTSTDIAWATNLDAGDVLKNIKVRCIKHPNRAGLCAIRED